MPNVYDLYRNNPFGYAFIATLIVLAFAFLAIVVTIP